jgi:uroporphyrinogen decarboxylase
MILAPLLVRAARREPVDRTPVWFMRQAGRILPEYRAVRERLTLVEISERPDVAVEVTLQPLRRFPQLDAAILFSDILIVPFAIGQNLSFVAGEGPRLTPTLLDGRIRDLEPQMQRLEPIYETVRRVKAQLSPETTFLGFAGSPWTVATYMIAGQGSREQAESRRLAYADSGKLHAILDLIVTVTGDYLSGHIEGGGEAVHELDSWSGILAPAEF